MISEFNNPPSGNQVSRRDFVRSALAVSALSAFPFLTTTAKGEKPLQKTVMAPPNERINLACCGIGNRGAEVIQGLVATGLVNIVALCDTDMGAKHTEKILKQFPDVPRFQDFRKMFDKMGNQIQAVTAGVPDFAHFPISMLAMSLGKHVYCEKPMARTFQEVELMMQAEKKYKVACQMGNQGHSEANYFQFKAWTEAGIIKNVSRITAFMNAGRRWHGKTPESLLTAGDKPLPTSLDWDTWLGTAAFHKYNENYINGQWRCWYDFGMGALGDWGAHILDTAHQFLDLGLPEEVAAVHLQGHDASIFPQETTLSFKFPARGAMPPVEIEWFDGKNNAPKLPSDFGDAVVDGNIPPPSVGKLEKTKKVTTGKVIYGEGLTFKGGSHGSTLKIIPEAKGQEMAATLPTFGKGSNHFKNFVLACKGQEQTRSCFAVAGPLSQVMVLGVLAQRLNTKLVFDRASKQITNNKEANDLLAPPPRKGWEEFYRL